MSPSEGQFVEIQSGQVKLRGLQRPGRNEGKWAEKETSVACMESLHPVSAMATQFSLILTRMQVPLMTTQTFKTHRKLISFYVVN